MVVERPLAARLPREVSCDYIKILSSADAVLCVGFHITTATLLGVSAPSYNEMYEPSPSCLRSSVQLCLRMQGHQGPALWLCLWPTCLGCAPAAAAWPAAATAQALACRTPAPMLVGLHRRRATAGPRGWGPVLLLPLPVGLWSGLWR